MKRGALKLCSPTTFRSILIQQLREVAFTNSISRILFSEFLVRKISSSQNEAKTGRPKSPRSFFSPNCSASPVASNHVKLGPPRADRNEARRLVAMPAAGAVVPTAHNDLVPAVE